MAAARAVGDDEGAGVRRANLGQKRQLAHLQRDLVMRGLVAEAARQSTAGGLDRLDSQPRHESERLLDGRHRYESLLVAMTVDKGLLLGERLQLERKAARRALRREKLLEQERPFRERIGLPPRKQSFELVAQREQARRLEADDGNAALHVELEGGEHAP